MHEILSAVPVILSLVIIEGLLSIDNAMAIAAMASELPERDQNKALRYGIVGAYLARGVCLASTAWIVSHVWLKAAGAVYLLYLMFAHLFKVNRDEEKATKTPNGFWRTVVAIEIMDLTLSLDNVVAAVALDRRLWVICTGVFIGILTLRFVAGACIRLIEKFPVLKTTAFLLVGYVGLLLAADISLENIGSAYRTTGLIKFGGIFGITASSLIISKISTRNRTHVTAEAKRQAMRSGDALGR